MTAHKPSFTLYIATVQSRGVSLSTSETETAEMDYAAGYGAGRSDGFAAGYAAALGTGT